MKKIAVTCLMPFLFACAAQDQDTVTLEKRLKIGRKVSTASQESGSDFSLQTDNSVASSIQDSVTGAVVYLAYNTQLSEAGDLHGADRHCRSASENQIFMLGEGELRPNPRLLQRLNESLIAVTYDRFLDDIPVRDAYFQCIYADDGKGKIKLREVLNRTYAGHRIENETSQTPDFALIAANSGRPLSLKRQRRIVFAHADGDDNVTLWHATEFVADDTASGEELTLTVRSDDGSLLEAFSNQYAASYEVRGDIFDRTYLNSQRKSFTLPLMDLIVSGSTVSTDVDGEVNLENPTNISARLQSARVRVFDAAVSTTNIMNIPASVTDENKIQLIPDASGAIGLNGYMSILRINEFTRRHLDANQAQILNQSISLRVNVTGTCNAFYNGGISMFLAGQGCANTALVNDVIYHEWGHGLDNFTGTNVGITDGAFSEGIGDILTAYYTGDSNLAPGFISNQAAGIRNLKNTRRFPNDRGEVHVEGQIIGGAFWDMREGLMKRLGPIRGAYHAEQLFFKHLLTTDSYRDSYTAVLRLDDDDNNPATPSPNHCVINSAFAAHGLANAENCTDAPHKEAYSPGDLALTLTQGSGTSFLSTAPDLHFMYLCFDEELACLASKKIDLQLERSGVIGQMNLFSGTTTTSLTVNTPVTLVGQDEYGTIKNTRTFRLKTR